MQIFCDFRARFGAFWGVFVAKIIQVLRDINELIVFKHSVFALPFIFIAMCVASFLQGGSAWFGWRLCVLGVLCAVSARNFAMATNRLLDAKIDAPNPRCATRPSVDGRIGRGNLLAFIALNAVVFVAVAWAINPLAFKLAVPILAVLAGYSLFKRFSAAAHLVLGLCLGLAPVAGCIAVSGGVSAWAAVLCAGVMFWVAGFDVLYSLQDLDYDRKAGLHSIPARFGAAGAMRISAAFHALAVAGWAGFVWLAGLGAVAWCGVAINAAILCAEHCIVRRDFSKIDRAFFTLNGYLGVAFFALVLIDLNL